MKILYKAYLIYRSLSTVLIVLELIGNKRIKNVKINMFLYSFKLQILAPNH